MKFKAIILFLIFFTSISLAQVTKVGAGVIFGDPSGLSVKLWTNSQNAIVFGLGYSFTGKNNSTNVHADYLWHNDNAIKTSILIPIYYGVGGRLKVRDGSTGKVGVRGVIGATYFPPEFPVDLFIEAVPVFNIIPTTAIDLEAGFGIRYYFR